MFEQPGVKNIRERKAANEARQRREREGTDTGTDNTPPPKGTIAHLLWAARQKFTPEQIAEHQRRSREIDERLTREAIARHRCGECGADTLNYSHSFRCSWRGSGF